MVRTRFAAIHPFHQRPLSQFANVLTLTLNGTNKICFPRSACLFIFFGLLSFFPVSKATQQKLESPSKHKLSCTSNAQTTLSISKKPRLPNALGSFTSGCFFALLPGPFLTVLSILLPIFTANNLPHTCKLVVEHTRAHVPPAQRHSRRRTVYLWTAGITKFHQQGWFARSCARFAQTCSRKMPLLVLVSFSGTLTQSLLSSGPLFGGK